MWYSLSIWFDLKLQHAAIVFQFFKATTNLNRQPYCRNDITWFSKKFHNSYLPAYSRRSSWITSKVLTQKRIILHKSKFACWSLFIKTNNGQNARSTCLKQNRKKHVTVRRMVIEKAQPSKYNSIEPSRKHQNKNAIKILTNRYIIEKQCCWLLCTQTQPLRICSCAF